MLLLGSWEERCVAVADYGTKNLGVDDVQLVIYGEKNGKPHPGAAANIKKIKQICSREGANFRTTISNVLDQELPNKVGATVDILDVSCFTKYHILHLLATKKFWKATYCPAASHEMNPPIVRQKKVIQIPGYAGRRISNREDLLFILAGFEGARSLNVYKYLAPSRCVLCIGVPWYEPGTAIKYVENAVVQNEMLTDSTNVRVETVPSMDARGFAARFVELVKSYVVEFQPLPNIAVVPLGTKIQAVGLFLASRILKEMQVLYPIPEKYVDIAKGAGKVMEIDLDN